MVIPESPLVNALQLRLWQKCQFGNLKAKPKILSSHGEANAARLGSGSGPTDKGNYDNISAGQETIVCKEKISKAGRLVLKRRLQLSFRQNDNSYFPFRCTGL
jgi:hypothetical protein